MRKALFLLFGAACASSFGQLVLQSGYAVEEFTRGIAVPTTMAFIGPEEFFICEKNTGIVKHRLHGKWLADVLDVNVAISGELGLLGICVDPNFKQTPYVYVFYSAADFDGGEWREDRVDKYVYDGERLNFVQNLLTLPYDPLQNNGSSHHGGYMVIGPDDKLYVSYGDGGRGRWDNPRIETNTGKQLPSGTSAIYRLNLDGTIPFDNPFTFYQFPEIRRIWIYGMRNNFGMAFDPLSGNFWFTENGSTNYDELNRGFGGMNSGWLKIMGPDSRDATYDENNNTPFDASDLTYLGGAFYRDPEFSWLETIGPTSIAFPTAPKFGSPLTESMLVGDVNHGQIYAFRLNASRDQIVYLPGTEDKVADTAFERDEYLFGTGFGLVTDLKMSPEGYLYVIDLGDSIIYRIRPVQESVNADGFQVGSGVLESGDVQSFWSSDGNDFVIQFSRGPGFSLNQVSVEVSYHAPTASFSQMKIGFDTSEIGADLSQTIELLNRTTGKWETVSLGGVGTGVVNVLGSASRFIDADSMEIRARITAKPTQPPLLPNWQFSIDRLSMDLRF